jgi:hypothetical protein
VRFVPHLLVEHDDGAPLRIVGLVSRISEILLGLLK